MKVTSPITIVTDSPFNTVVAPGCSTIRLALAAGVGLYNYFDTTASDEGKPYADAHGWALKQKARDPEMRQTKKRGNWHFGMKLHIGVDSRSGLAHSAVVTAANVHDKHAIPQLLHGQEQRVYGDNAYASQKALIHGKAPKARDVTNQRTRRNGVVDEVARRKNRNKSRIRARVEHVFAVVKRLWGFTKVRYRGLAKNANRAFVTLALANVYLCRRHLLAQVRP